MEPPSMTGYPKAHELMEKIMNAKINLPSMMIGVIACLLGVALFACDAAAQTAKDLVGTWTPVSITAVQDGKTIEPYGPNPKALLMFDDKGRYASLIIRSDLPKFASNNRTTGTADENKAAVAGSLAHYGTYRVEDGGKSLVLRTEPGFPSAPRRRGSPVEEGSTQRVVD